MPEGMIIQKADHLGISVYPRSSLRSKPAVFLLLAGLIGLGACASERSMALRPIEETTDAAQMAFSLAQQAYERMDYGDASDRYQKIIEDHPGSGFLEEAQWMLAKSDEMQGKWTRALAQYEKFTLNYPGSSHAREVHLRMELLRELLENRPLEPVRPRLRAIQIQNADPTPVSLDHYVRNGMNSVVVEVTGGRLELSPDLIGRSHRAGLFVFALMKLDLRDLFDPKRRSFLKRLVAEVSIQGMDGIFIEGNNYSVGEWLHRDITDLFDESFGTETGPETLIKDATLYWRWAGWRGRTIMMRLDEIVRPAKGIRGNFYWGMVFPEEAVTRPHIALSRAGLDLVEAKARDLDYFAVKTRSGESDPGVIRRAVDLVSDPNRVLEIVQVPPGGIPPSDPESLEFGILYVNHRVGSE